MTSPSPVQEKIAEISFEIFQTHDDANILDACEQIAEWMMSELQTRSKSDRVLEFLKEQEDQLFAAREKA